MGLDNAIHTLSNINAIMGSTVGYINDKKNGVSTGDAISNMGFNIINGALRNQASKDIKDMTGSYIGYALNNVAGYGNAEANAKGTNATIGAAMLASNGIFSQGCHHHHNPFGYGVTYQTMSCSTFLPFGSIPSFTQYGSGPIGNPCWHTKPHFDGPSFFSSNGCWC